MSGRRAKADRKIVNDARNQALQAMSGPHNAVAENERETRDRVGDIEEWARAFTHMTLKQRFRWLMLGR